MIDPIVYHPHLALPFPLKKPERRNTKGRK